MGVDGRTHGSKVTHLGAINLSSKVSSHAQEDILGGTDVLLFYNMALFWKKNHI
jgi:hypothetical protein